MKRLSLLALGLFFVLAHVLVLPPDGWITGDQGSKFLQTRAFARQGPLNPGIDVLSHDVDPEYRQQEPKLDYRKGRLVSEFLWLLPLTTAPFYALLGLRGLYVIPALSVLTIFVAAAALGRRMGQGRGLLTAWLVVLVTPSLLYGLELWEHAPAAAATVVAAVLLAPDEAGRSTRSRVALSGAAIAVGALFREEVIAAIPAFLLARAVAQTGYSLRAFIEDGLMVALGAGVVFLAAVPMNLLIYGAPLPMHMTQDAWEVVKTTPYVQMRWDIVHNLFLPQRWTVAFLAALVAGVLAGALERWRSGTLPLAHAAVLVLLAIGVGSPLWRLAHGLSVQNAFEVMSAAHTWPFALALLYLPWVAGHGNIRMTRYLLVGGLLLIGIITLLVPMDGGAQWSPRFYLGAAPVLAVVAVSALAPTSPPSIAIMTAGILFASALMQLQGLLWVREAKSNSARLTHAIAGNVRPEEVIITDVYWLPELTATLAPDRRMLLASTYLDIPATVATTRLRGRPHVVIVNSYPLTGYRPPDAFDPPIVPCHLARTRQMPLAFGLVMTHYSCPGE